VIDIMFKVLVIV